MTTERTRWIVGCMTGTSLDALDVALTQITGEGLKIAAAYRGMTSVKMGTLAETLRKFASGQAAMPLEFLRASRALGELHAQAVQSLCREHLPAGAKLDFVVAHGQTIWHAPDEHVSWQLMDPWPLVRLLCVPVLYDLRQADLIAGGQGAPITPLADWVLYREHAQVIVNLGGICNITHLGDTITGLDLCPCNLLIDRVVQQVYPDESFDCDGNHAAKGHGEAAWFDSIMAELPSRRSVRRSLGREDYPDARIASVVRELLKSHTSDDVIRAAVESVAAVITDYVRETNAKRVVLAGGATRNRQLVASIRAGCRDAIVLTSDDVGIASEAREAMGFAVLGALTHDGVSITLPQVTGAKQPGRAGVWAYP